jgi:DNA-binding winged helix-turn-helix (wHTH) protein
MSKICILSENTAFAEDLVQQIMREIPTMEATTELSGEEEIVFVDEKDALLETIGEKAASVLFSSHQESSEYADLVIKKPFLLYGFLQALKNNTLLPKIRRKASFSFKEYTCYPVKKEIVSALSRQTTKLTEKEVAILKYLYQKQNQITGKEELLENVWGYSPDATTHTIETHIYRLRQKVEQGSASQLIITENNGYRLNM